jgi:hypothetical protein
MILHPSLKCKGIIAFAFLFFSAVTAFAQTTFYNVDTIQKLEISFTQPDWDYQMDTSKSGQEGYILAEWVKINGIQYDSVGVKYKGNSSYNSTYAKNPIHISLDKYKNQSYQGLVDIKLGNGYADPSMIREVMAYDMLSNYMDCPRSNFAQLYINGAYTGLYSNTEDISEQFLSDHFYSSDNEFVKCNPTISPGPATKSNLKYIPSVDSTGYFNYYEVKSSQGWNELVALCDTVTNYSANVGSIMDMDRAIWMLAFDNVTVNLDSYLGAFAQNYYLYKDNNHRFNPVIWDLNMSFGGFPFLGSGTSSLGTLTVTNMQQLSPAAHSTDIYWPLINAIQSNPVYKRMYIAHMRTISNEMFASSYYTGLAAQLQAIADTAVFSDANKFFSYTQFQAGLTGNVTFGSNTIPGISNLMGPRLTYLGATADFGYSTPAISAINTSSTSPALGTTVYVSAQVLNTNTNGVSLGYRFINSDKFSKLMMYDDGLHGDGTSGDNVYGASFTMSSSNVSYYIYAENNNAGMFSPERAEHEFYTLQAAIVTAAPGQVKINEVLASNVNGVTSEYGNHSDWIELYNTTSAPLSLYGLYLTDNYAVPMKFTLPDYAVLPANGRLMVFADQNTSTASFIHANFKLSGSGEQVMLSNGTGVVHDSVTFGAQTADMSYSRCPDGSGSFVITAPTFNLANCVAGIPEDRDAGGITVYPNPASSVIYVDLAGAGPLSWTLYNTLGETVLDGEFNRSHNEIDIAPLRPGMYFMRLGDGRTLKVQKLD